MDGFCWKELCLAAGLVVVAVGRYCIVVLMSWFFFCIFAFACYCVLRILLLLMSVAVRGAGRAVKWRAGGSCSYIYCRR